MLHDQQPVKPTPRLMRLLILPRRCPNPHFGLQDIAEPMCLSQMLKGLIENAYGSPVDGDGLRLFAYHLCLIKENCLEFNGVSGQERADC